MLVWTVVHGHMKYLDLKPRLSTVTYFRAADWLSYWFAVSSVLYPLPSSPNTPAQTDIVACEITDAIKTTMAVVTVACEDRATRSRFPPHILALIRKGKRWTRRQFVRHRDCEHLLAEYHCVYKSVKTAIRQA